MTLGIGLKCPEGVVMLTDSMAIRHDHIGMATPLPGYRKTDWLESIRSAAIVSGTMVPELLAGRTDTDFRGAVSQFFADLTDYQAYDLALYHPAFQQLERRLEEENPALKDWPQLLVGGGPLGEPPKLACLKPSGEQWAMNGGSALFAIGSWTYAWLEPQGRMTEKVPDRLDEARRLTVDWAREYIEWQYKGKTLADHMAEGNLISVGYPLYLTIFDAAGRLEQEVIPE